MKIVFSGDICVREDVDDIFVTQEVKDFFSKSDFSFCCLEAPYLTKKNQEPSKKAGPNLAQKHVVSSLLHYFTHVTLANNHVMDYGDDGLQDTMSYLDESGIKYGGAGKRYDDIYKPVILSKDGISVAVLCLAEAQFGTSKSRIEERAGYAWILSPVVPNIIKEISEQVDVVICFAHAGLEMSDYPLPEWREYYRSLIDYGCDMVIACHPHVIQGKELYKGKEIYYSLGNFFFNSNIRDGRWNKSLNLCVEIDSNGTRTVQEFFSSFSLNQILAVKEGEDKEHFNKLSHLLCQNHSIEYYQKVNAEVLKCWNDFYESYFSYPIFLPCERNFKNKIIRRIVFKYLYKIIKPPVGTIMLYHNMEVDTHRFAISRALSLKNEIH